MRAVRHGLAVAAAMWAGLSAQGGAGVPALAEMREALGGDAALLTIESFVLSGTQTRIADVGPPINRRVEIGCQLPDKYLRTYTVMRPTRAPNGSTYVGPGSSSFEGFSVDVPVRGSRDAAGRPNATFVASPASPEEGERRMTLVARGYRQEFARLTLPLLGASFSGYSLELKYLGREARDDQQVDVVEAVAPDGFTARLFIDAGTHLPIAISWSAIPSIVITTGRASVRGGPSAPVEHAMLFSDFRAERGVKWPRAIREYAGTRLIQETRIEKVVFNPKLPPDYFSAPR